MTRDSRPVSRAKLSSRKRDCRARLTFAWTSSIFDWSHFFFRIEFRSREFAYFFRFFEEIGLNTKENEQFPRVFFLIFAVESRPFLPSFFSLSHAVPLLARSHRRIYIIMCSRIFHARNLFAANMFARASLSRPCFRNVWNLNILASPSTFLQYYLLYTVHYTFK